MRASQVQDKPTTDRYRSPAPIGHGSSKVERLIEAQRVGGASPSRGTISRLLNWTNTECFLIGLFVGTALTVWYRVWEINHMRGRW